MPGQSAVVGDRPNGKPGPNAEMVTAIPGGGFVVHPNPKNAPPMPRFADGTPPGMVFAGGTRANAYPPTEADKQQAIIDASKPSPWISHPIDTAGSAIGYAWDSATEPAVKAIAGGMHSLDFAIHGDYPARQAAQAKLDFFKKTGNAFDAEPPTITPPGTVGTPSSLAFNTFKTNAAGQAVTDQLMKGSEVYHPELGPTTSGLPHDALPVKAAPEPAWNANQLNAYALRQQTNERMGLSQGMPGWVDPNDAAKQMGQMPQTQGGPTMMAAPIDPTARANNILSGWAAQKMPEAPPPGLSPIAQQSWLEQRARMSNTREGRAQIESVELGRNAMLAKEQRTIQGRESVWDHKQTPFLVDTPSGPVTYVNGRQVHIPKPLPVHPSAGVSLIGGTNLATVSDGQKQYLMKKDATGNFVPASSKEIPQKQVPKHPAAGVYPTDTPGVFIGHDGTGKTQLLEQHPGGNYVKLGTKAEAETKPKEIPYWDPEGRKIVHIVATHKPPASSGLVQMDESATPPQVPAGTRVTKL